MRLEDVELLPSVIISDIDPKKLGRVKCTVPGYLNGETMSVANMPWVYPLTMSGYQSFSRPIKGQKVWVMKNLKNEKEYWYFPMFELNKASKEYLDGPYGQDHPEIVYARNSGGSSATLTYDDSGGFNMTVNRHHIQVMHDGTVDITGGSGSVRIKSGVVYTGTAEDGYEPALMGRKVNKCLSKLSAQLKALATKAQADPHTAILAQGFRDAADTISPSALNECLCKSTEVN